MRAGQEHRVIGQGWGQIQDGIAVVQMAAEVAEARCLFRKSLASFLGLPLIRPGWV